jgi:aryl-phospho-beta-D-glucosidase BglC (GH1 family)
MGWLWILTSTKCFLLLYVLRSVSRPYCKVTYCVLIQENQMSNSQHISTACGKASSLSTFDLWLIVGEWTPAANDCAKYLNGRGVGSRYDGSYPGSTRVGSCNGLTGRASTFSSSYKTFLRQYWEAQTITYEKAQGWIQWTWKAENADEWTYQAGLANGWIPQNPTNRQYPTICG